MTQNKMLQDTIIQLEMENAQLKNIIDRLPGYIYWKNKEGVWLGVNEAGCESMKKMGFIKDKSEVIGKTDYQLFKKETADIFRKHDLEVMEKNREVKKEEINHLSSGEKIMQLSTKRPLWNKEGAVVGIVGNTIDITSLKEIEIALQTAKEKAEAANRSKTEFIANMSHDIRTPLAGIIGMAEILEHKIKDVEQKNCVNLLRTSGEQLLALLNDVLETASEDKMQKEDTQNELCDLRALVETIVSLEMPAVTSKKLTLKIDIDESVPNCVLINQTRLYRILLNLLGNAIKFTKTGSITIAIQVLEQAESYVRLRFSVEDTGIGIDKANQDKLFERFHCVNPAYTSAYKSYGIGLHITQQYVEQLGGKIEFISEMGKGSTFYFDLTLKKGERGSIAINSYPTKAQKPPSIFKNAPTEPLSNTTESKLPHILLVEDSPVALFALQETIKHANCEVTTAEDGAQALTLATSMDFDLIITDIELPGLTGFELSQRIREWEKATDRTAIPIVALTGYTEIPPEKYRQSGINKILTKPLATKTITQLLDNLSHLAQQ